MTFPIDLSGYKPLQFTTNQTGLTDEQRETLKINIGLVRDSLIFFTALANVKGLGGHTGGAYDIVPEVLIMDGFMKGDDRFFPVYFDEAGHRVAIQYMMAALNGQKSTQDLMHYREFGKGLYGHPERDEAAGVFFSSGRLGHLWSYVNGVAEADRDKVLVMFGSDGSQQEGDDAEAARYAVARGLNVKLIIDDNDVTIAGHPSEYMKGYDVGKTLYSSPVYADGKLFMMDNDGVMRIYEFGKEMKVIAENKLGEPSGTTPAFADGHIFIRGEEHLYCIGK